MNHLSLSATSTYTYTPYGLPPTIYSTQATYPIPSDIDLDTVSFRQVDSVKADNMQESILIRILKESES